MSIFSAWKSGRKVVVAGLWAVALAAGASPAAGPQWPGRQADGSVLLPNQWTIQPVGRQVAVGDFPVNLALHPAGRYVAVLHCGFGPHEVRILDLETETEVSRQPVEEAFYGLAWSPDGGRLFVSGAGDEVIHVFDFARGLLSHPRRLALRDPKEQGVPAGLAVSADGRFLYIAEAWGQRVEKISTEDGHRRWELSLAPASGRAVTDPQGQRWQLALLLRAALIFLGPTNGPHLICVGSLQLYYTSAFGRFPSSSTFEDAHDTAILLKAQETWSRFAASACRSRRLSATAARTVAEPVTNI